MTMRAPGPATAHRVARAPSLTMSIYSRVVVVLACALVAGSASAYEGAGIQREVADAGVPPPAPQLTKAPELLKFVEATYPPEALARGESAEVAFAIDIDETGKVSQAEVTRSAGP